MRHMARKWEEETVLHLRGAQVYEGPQQQRIQSSTHLLHPLPPWQGPPECHEAGQAQNPRCVPRKSTCTIRGCRGHKEGPKYIHLQPPWNDENRFLELMILDSCYMLEFLIHATGKLMEDLNDLLFITNTDKWKVFDDALLLENQVPHPALHILVEIGGDKRNVDHFREYNRASRKSQYTKKQESGLHLSTRGDL